MIDTKFPISDIETWRALAAKTLRDRPFESLESRTLEGLPIAPLYKAAANAAAPARVIDPDRHWDVRTAIRHPDPAHANKDILTDLAGGAASVLVQIDPTGQTGVALGGADALAHTLRDVVVEFAAVALDAGFLGPRAAEWLGAVGKASPEAALLFHMDPLGALAKTGASPGPIESHLVAAATVGARLSGTYPRARLFLASGQVVHEAGGGEAGELAFMLASGVAYAKALVRAGQPVGQAISSVALGVAADADIFLTIAKIRAGRALWARITEACAVDAPPYIEARSSGRMLTVQDPWTNMLRLTAAGFGAAVGGADAVVLGTFTDALGAPTAFARRQSRNAQLVLLEEAHIGRVADPAAGSGYVEALTTEISQAAWRAFQAIEAQGGAIAALRSGHIAAEADAVRAARERAGEPRIVGVTAFPPTQAAPVEIDRPECRPVDAPSPRLPGPDTTCPPLRAIRLSEAYEGAA